MNNYPQTHLHPLEKADALESPLRLLLQNPRRILKKYIHSGMTVLDLGCGTGYFTLEIAKLLEKKGKVIATDVQKGMLEILKQKLRKSELHNLIQIHNSQESTLGLTEKVDFIFAFYFVHEVPDQEVLFKEVFSLLKPGGKMFIVEPPFHVSKAKFKEMMNVIEKTGFEITAFPRLSINRTVLIHKSV